MKLKTMELSFTRTIPASPEEVYDAWLDTKNPGCPWHDAAKLIFEPKVGNLYYFLYVPKEGDSKPHFGRFVTLERGRKLEMTWMSRHTCGLESVVSITLKKQGEDTLLTLVHSNIPDDEMGRGHEGGWNHFLDIFAKRLGAKLAA